jgi:hypothetical protein
MRCDLPEGAPHGGGGFYGSKTAKAKEGTREPAGAEGPAPVRRTP